MGGLDQTVALVRAGGVIAYPTDTVWGLGGDARRPDVIARVRALKGRSRKPMLVLTDGVGRVQSWVNDVPEPLARILGSRIPATVLLCASPSAPAGLVGDEGWIGVRCPSGWTGELCAHLALPLLSTSANPSGSPTATSRSALHARLLRGVDAVADGPEPAAGRPSTLVRFDGAGLVVLRAGAASIGQLEQVAECGVKSGVAG